MRDAKDNLYRLLGASLALAAFLAASGTAYAAPAKPGLREHTQSDGTKVLLRMRGDEYHHWAEDKAGYTLMKGADGRDWFYARQDADGALKPGPNRAGSADPERLGLKKNLKDDRKAAAASQRRRAENAARRKRAASSPFRVSAPGGATPSSISGAAPARAPILTGTMKNLVVLARFSDVTYTYGQSLFNDLFNKIGYTYDGAHGSLKDYYLEVSYGNLTVDSVVTAWITLPQTEAYYGANDAQGYDLRPRQMVLDALAALEAGGFDFRQVDGNSDGQIDGLTIIHSGFGEEASYGEAPNAVWSHQWELASPVTYDGVTIQNYHTEAEKRGLASSPSTIGLTRIGVIAHETGHFLGLPDLYDTDGSVSGYGSGIGAFCLMSGGTWNGPLGDGESPAHPSAPCKKELGWAVPTQITTDGLKTIARIQDNPAALYLLRGSGWSLNEYILVENRQGYGFDTYLPGSMRGLLIWHVDENQADNNDPTHYLVDLEEAGGTQHLQLSDGVYGDDQDYFRAGNNTSFTDTTTPNSKTYTGLSLNYPISAVSATGNTMTFYVGTQDVTAPSAPASVYDGTETGVDIDGTGSLSELSANWTASSDAESGITAYYYAIGTSPGSTNVAGWTSNGTSRSVTRTGLALAIGTTYYFGVKALNGAALYSTAAWSDGQVVTETLAEAPAYINDGTGADQDYARSLSSLSANWGASPTAGITDYQYAIGTTPGGTNIISWTSTGTVRAVTRTGLTLSQATTYYFSVRCKTAANVSYSAAMVSDGQKTDTIAPTARVESLSLPAGGTGAFSAKLIITDANGVSGTPQLNFTASNGRVVPVTLSFLFSSTWTVSGSIESYYSTGTAAFHFSASDPAGNSGTSLTSGSAFTINYAITGASGGSVVNSDGMAVTVPAGAAAGTLFVSVSTVASASVSAADAASADSRKIYISDLARDFSARDNAGAAITSFASPVTITMAYPDADNDGRIDSDLINEDLAWIYYLDAAAGRWTPLENVTRNASANTLTAQVPHFSVYSVRAAGTASPGMGDLKAYPNPCDFRAASGLTIEGIPPDAASPRVYIYNSAGELVRTLTRGDGVNSLNVVTWDGRADGGKAASGLYIYVVRTSNYGKGKGKFYVIW